MAIESRVRALKLGARHDHDRRSALDPKSAIAADVEPY
jgi:hypothetical protein